MEEVLGQGDTSQTGSVHTGTCGLLQEQPACGSGREFPEYFSIRAGSVRVLAGHRGYAPLVPAVPAF